MKSIHTYVNLVENATIDKKNLYHMLLSTLLSNVFFKETTLYCTKKIKEIVEYVGIPYKEIITEPFDNYDSGTFSIPKLITYSLQQEPFIHIDLDSHFYHIDNDKLKELDIFYSYPDMVMGEKSQFEDIEKIHNTYLKGIYTISDKIPKELKDNILLTEIPNFCVFGGKNYKLISDASLYCLDFYRENKEFFDSDYYNACIIEQLLVPSAIRMLSDDKEHNYTYLYEIEDKFMINMESKSFTGLEYPYEIQMNQRHKVIRNENELYSLANYDFNKMIHFNGYKQMEIVMFIVREMITHRFNGYKYINRINEIYPEIYEFEKIGYRYYTQLNEKINNWGKTIKKMIL